MTVHCCLHKWYVTSYPKLDTMNRPTITFLEVRQCLLLPPFSIPCFLPVPQIPKKQTIIATDSIYLLDLLTPAPMTPGSFSSPTLKSMPTDRLTSPTRATVDPAMSQNCVLTSCLAHVLPAQKVRLWTPLSSLMVGAHTQWKHTSALLSADVSGLLSSALKRLWQAPWPEQLSVAFMQAEAEEKQVGILRSAAVDADDDEDTGCFLCPVALAECSFARGSVMTASEAWRRFRVLVALVHSLTPAVRLLSGTRRIMTSMCFLVVAARRVSKFEVREERNSGFYRYH